MRLLSVEIRNFLSFGGDTQLIDLDRLGLVAVLGKNEDFPGADSNGAGKSTVLEAIVWSLYGETMRGYRGDSVVNRSCGKNCSVVITLEDNGASYVVRRTRRMSSSKRPNDLSLTVDGNDVTQGTNADTQALVQTLMGMNFQTFTQSIMMSHGSRPFSQLRDSEQKAVLENILQIDKISKAKELVRNRIVSRQQDLATARGKLEAVKTRGIDAETTFTKLQLQKSQHASLVEERRLELLCDKTKAETKIVELTTSSSLVKLLVNQAELRKQEEGVLTKKNHEQAEQLKITRKFAIKKTKIAKEEGAAQALLQQIRQESCSMDALVGRPCPTCKQILTPEFAETKMDSWEAESNKIRSATLVRIQAKTKRTERAEESAFKKLRKNEESLNVELESLQGQLRIATEAVHKRTATLQLICQLEQQAWGFQQEIDRITAQENPYTTLIQEAEGQIESLNDEERDLSYKIRGVEVELEHLNYWNYGFGNRGLKSYILDSVVPFLTERAQEYADILSGGDLKIEFSTQTQLKNGEWRDQFQVIVTNEHGADVYHGNSEGEKRRIDVAVGWALADLSALRAKKSIRFRALDEPFESLDETGEEAVVKLLHTVVPQYETIMCVTHSTHLRNQFPEELLVVKKNGTSTIGSPVG